MDDTRAARLVGRALRCYPARWRRRHGDEAAELAALLIRDGAWPGSIALSYLAGAAREWLTPRPGQRLSTAACALLIAACSLSVSVVLVAAPTSARAALTPTRAKGGAGTSQVRGRVHCRPGGPAASPVPGLIRAMGQLPTVIWETGHDRTC